MKLKSLTKGLDVVVKGSKEVEITGVSADSRTVAPGNLFIAKKGAAHDGNQFISQAINAGACAIATDIYDPFLEVPQIIHSNTNLIEAKLASRYYGQPSKDLFVVGVTGSKGKTTTTYLIKHLLDALNKRSGLIGTIETIFAEHRFFSSMTTHDAITNQKWLKEMLNKGCKAAVLEVSSHGLAQGRVDEIDFDLGVFMNLYPDHLDFHKSIEEYAAAKRKLFEKAHHNILNADSPWAEFMGKGLTFGIEKGDLRAQKIVLSAEGSRFEVDGCEFSTPLIGKFNVYNAMAAIAVGVQVGASLHEIQHIMSHFDAVPGRMERIGNVFVDFAHTGEALENVLQTLKEIAKGRVIVVFGCGGQRDPGRRVSMAKAAQKWADISIITSDNPRKEDPNEIARQIVAEFQNKPHVELDRKKAIAIAIAMAGKDDMVVVAGRGHEKVQILAQQTVAFDDAETVKNILQNKVGLDAPSHSLL
ncbi:MAG: UDP-N-acetylmuramoyl-L-alanyl-D-glutamate--2,6-diaminopimelate ligase [Chlamydiae bacterium CG10_big_fil_rev_8_21_14_0_10_42_34]|nr:MAG: UDP-N-acetylmuramoyl-L-alanyl-D-glutamate--2,6-diaminopimelate ligase [Chlamydiae bacterium CG10_big_fil_rev_8_21_14_0_10_42_34]